MSPIVARAAIRAATQAQQARQFSVMRTMRDVARSFEAHPFQRLPNKTNSQAGDYMKLVKRSANQVLIYIPGLGLVLGWPFLAQKALDGHI